MADKIKIALAALLVVAGLAGFYYFADMPAIVRVGSVLAGLAAAAFVFWTTEPGKQFYVYRAGIGRRDQEGRLADPQGNAADDRHRVRVRASSWRCSCGPSTRACCGSCKKLMGTGE